MSNNYMNYYNIVALLKGIRDTEERERLQKERMEQMIKIKVYTNSSESGYFPSQKNIYCYGDMAWIEVLQQAYEKFGVAQYENIEYCRLVLYNKTTGHKELSFENRNSESILSIIETTKEKYKIDYFELFLEVQGYIGDAEVEKFFLPYSWNDAFIDIYHLIIDKEEVTNTNFMRRPVTITVGQLKQEIEDIFCKISKNAVFVLESKDLITGCATLRMLTSDEKLLQHCNVLSFKVLEEYKDIEFRNKVFVYEECGEDGGKVATFLKRVSDITTLHLFLPKINDDILEDLEITPLAKHNGNNNLIDSVPNDQTCINQTDTRDRYQSNSDSVNLQNNLIDSITLDDKSKSADRLGLFNSYETEVEIENENDEQNSKNANAKLIDTFFRLWENAAEQKKEEINDVKEIAEGDDECNDKYCLKSRPSVICTTSEQSTSEESSLTDSERTIINETPNENLEISSINIYDSTNPGKLETGKAKCIDKDSPYDDQEAFFKVKIFPPDVIVVFINKYLPVSLVKEKLQECVGVPSKYLELYRSEHNVDRWEYDIIVTKLSIFPIVQKLKVKLVRTLEDYEMRVKLFLLLLPMKNYTAQFQPVYKLRNEVIISKGKTVREIKKKLHAYLTKRNKINFPIERMRLRKNNTKVACKVMLDDEILLQENETDPCCLYIQQLNEEEPIRNSSQISLFVGHWHPDSLTVHPYSEIILDNPSLQHLIDKIHSLSEIPKEFINIAAETKLSNNIFEEESYFEMLHDNYWSDTLMMNVVVQSSNNFSNKFVRDEFFIVYYRDSRVKPQGSVFGENLQGSIKVRKNYDFIKRREPFEEIPVRQTPRTEKGLKIYVNKANPVNANNENVNEDVE